MRLLDLLLLIAVLSGTADAAVEPWAGYQRDCEGRAERLWGRAICAPVVVVDPATGNFRASRPAPGPLPALRANTAFDWNGETWVMLLEPLPDDPAELASILYHEGWHAHQEALGLPANMAVAAHLDDPVARYLIRLEWRALAEALGASGEARRLDAAQALAFRARRLAAFPAAADAERAQMRHEGLAAYTGVALSGAPDRLALAAIESGPARPSLSRSFAYVSGPAWGLLLDRMAPGWRGRLGSGSDLPDLLGLSPARVPAADRYGGTAILLEETLAGLERRTLLASALAATDESRALRLPLAQMNMDFDPNRVSPAPDGSTLYHRITLSDRWGRIRVEGTGLRIAADFSAAFAPWPLPPGALELSPGWWIEERPGGRAVATPTP